MYVTTVALQLVGLRLDEEVWLQALIRNIMLCSWEGHFTLAVFFSLLSQCLSPPRHINGD